MWNTWEKINVMEVVSYLRYFNNNYDLKQSSDFKLMVSEEVSDLPFKHHNRSKLYIKTLANSF